MRSLRESGRQAQTLTCNGGLNAPEVNGVAAFSDCSVNTAGTYSLTATDGVLPSTTSATFTVGTVGPPSQLVFTTEPGGAQDHALLSPQPVVTIEDASGNAIVGDFDHITLSITSNTGATGRCWAARTSNGLTVKAVDGVATFSNCSIDTQGTATRSPRPIPTTTRCQDVTSNSFNVEQASGTATQVAFTAEPGDGAPDALLNPQPVVAVEEPTATR